MAVSAPPLSDAAWRDNRRSTQRMMLGVLCAVMFCGLVGLILFHLQTRNRVNQQAQQRMHNETKRVAQELSSKLGAIEPLVHSLAQRLRSGELTRATLSQALERTFHSHPGIFEVGAAYAPPTDAPDKRYAPHYGFKEKVVQAFQLSYDYLRKNWYTDSLTQPEGHWIEPYFGGTTKELVAGFHVPFSEPGGSERPNALAGVVRINLSLEIIGALVASLDLGKTGYGFVISQQGKLLSYPFEEDVENQKTILDLADAHTNDTLRAMVDAAKHRQTGLWDYTDVITRKPAWLRSEPIPSIGWSLGAVFFKDEIFNTPQLQRQQIWIAIVLMVFLLCLTILVLQTACTREMQRLWSMVVATTVLFAACIGYIWAITMQFRDYTRVAEHIIVNQKRYNKMHCDTSQSNPVPSGGHHLNPLYIPTGVFVQSVEFTSANNVSLTGYVWQKYYADALNAKLSKGFILPEAVSTELTQAYNRIETDPQGRQYTLVGWYFESTLRQDFDYAKYPFDDKFVWLRLWHKDFGRYVILVPDLASYTLTNPLSLPGLEPQFVLPGWSTVSSFFEYKCRNYNTNFGIVDYVGQQNYPELYFTIHLRRNFKDAFITNLVPFLVVSCMLFAILMTVTGNEKRIALFDFNTSGVLGACSALFFVVLIAHIQLRREIAAQGIIYLEYFYFVLYGAILLISINAFLFTSESRLGFIVYHDNHYPKLAYWPCLLGALLVVTFLYFYPL